MIKSKTYILFTAYYCNYLSGSLIYVLEMCSYLLSKYDNVCIYIASPNVSNQIALLAKQKGVKICLLKKIPCDIVWDVVFALHAPVFEYDKFGGCGYIYVENIDKEAEKNFSGRTTNRKLSAQQIAEEIKAGFAKAVSQRLALQKIALQYFSINNIDLLIKQIEKAPITPKINLLNKIVLPDWIIRIVCCFIPVKKIRQKFRYKYRNRIA